LWTYRQSTGEIIHNGELIGIGYSGNGQWKNDPASQDIVDHGPLPRGLYTMTDLVKDHPKLGPYVIVLTPDPSNDMFGRSEFRWHGDSLLSPGNGSDGCIVSSRLIRVEAWSQNDHQLEVVE
jgi:hypothetical protein